jgi:hypothetical protein
MAYPKLNKVFNQAQFESLKGQKAQFQGRVVIVDTHETHNSYGSWERGFKFSDRTYALLTRTVMYRQRKNSRATKQNDYSVNYGASWHPSIREALKSKGKITLEQETHGEFAFEAIQRINRKWEGPGYRWRP